MGSILSWRDNVVGNWFVAGNWDPSIVPATTDTAIIETGTAIIAAATAPLIIGEAILLGGSDNGSPVTLHAIDTTFAGSGTGASEVDATITFGGSIPPIDALFIGEGTTSFDGQIFVEAIAGSLTIESRTDGNGVGIFRLVNTDEKAAIVVSQESFLDFEGHVFLNQSLIQIEGGAEISAGVTFTGDGGMFALEDGGHLVVEGNVDAAQQIVFVDGSGRLTIDNLAGFDGVIDYALPGVASGQPQQGVAGSQIDLTGVQAQSFQFVAGSGNTGTLYLYAGANRTGAVVAELTMGMVTDKLQVVAQTLSNADFVLGSDGDGGTLITYAPQGSTYLLASLPTPVVAEVGAVVSLASILQDSFGRSDLPFKGIWLFPTPPFQNTSTEVGYWESPGVTPAWFIGDQKVEQATFVRDISQVTLHVGNQIDTPPSFQMRLTKDKKGVDAGFVTYSVWTVDPRIIDHLDQAGFPPGTLPTPDLVAAAAQAFDFVYHNGLIPNTHLCNWIADNVAAGAGATNPFPNTSFDPSLNVEGGFWRIVYASDIPDPVDDWSILLQEGDMVRMGWFKPEEGRVSGHSTTVVSIDNSVVQFYDNNDNQHIGLHDAAYWLNTDPDDITIYRLDPNQQYLIQGTALSEVIYGSVYDNLIRPGGGADVIKAALGDTEIEGSAAQLDGIKLTDFDAGDSFHFTDLDLASVSVDYHGGKLRVFDDAMKVATIKLPKPPAGSSFVITADPDGGTLVELTANAPLHVSALTDPAHDGREGHAHAHDFDLL